MASTKKFCLVLTGYQVALTECDDAGQPVTRQVWKQYNVRGEFDRTPIKSAGKKTVTEIYEPHSSGGTATCDGIPEVVDATPRPFADAWAIASKCPCGWHNEPLNLEAAKTLVRITLS